VECFRPIARGLVDELAVRPGERVLDLGCGRGAALLPLAEGRSRAPFDSDAGVERLLSDAGLVRVRTVHRTVRAVFDDVEHWLAFSWSHGQRAMWEAVPTDRHPALRAELVAELSRLTNEQGGLTLDQQVRYTLGQRSDQT
jgi:hypothetical protein